MRRILSLLVCATLLLSLGLGATAHAMETTACVTAAESAGLHLEGDADQMPAGSDDGYSHHHGNCHGHHVAVETESSDTVEARAPRRGCAWRTATQRVTSRSDQRLRPPIA